VHRFGCALEAAASMLMVVVILFRGSAYEERFLGCPFEEVSLRERRCSDNGVGNGPGGWFGCVVGALRVRVRRFRLRELDGAIAAWAGNLDGAEEDPGFEGTSPVTLWISRTSFLMIFCTSTRRLSFPFLYTIMWSCQRRPRWAFMRLEIFRNSSFSSRCRSSL
jgi:hypothetical protein